MGLTMGIREVEIEGLDDLATEFATARLLTLDIPYGARWGTATIAFPEARAFKSTPSRGLPVTITYNEHILMKGHVISAPQNVSRQEDSCELTIADLRWMMGAVKIGQYGIGPVDPEAGGFPEVGYRVYFNPRGRPNRSVDPIESEENTYTFYSGPGARWWTREQALRLLLHYYAPWLLPPGSFGAAWAENVTDLPLYPMDIPNALQALAARAGESWALRYDEGDVYYDPITGTPADTITVILPSDEGTNKASSSTALSAIDVRTTPAIVDSVDIVEIHSNPTWVEHTHSNVALSEEDLKTPLLEGFVPKIPGYVYGYKVRVNAYHDGEAEPPAWSHNLGRNHEEGAQPKHWLRHNITRLKPSGDAYYDAEDDDMKAGLGQALRPEDCCWIKEESDETWHHVKSGIVVLPRLAMVLLRAKLTADDGWKFDSFPGDDFADVQIRITVTTELEHPRVIKSTPAGYHVHADWPITELIVRTDIKPTMRYESIVPDPATVQTDPNATVTKGEDPEWYVDVLTDMTNIGQKYLVARKLEENTIVVRTLEIPNVRLGQGLEISPTDAGLSGSEVIIRLFYDIDRGDYLTIVATNNLARLLVHDL